MTVVTGDRTQGTDESRDLVLRGVRLAGSDDLQDISVRHGRVAAVAPTLSVGPDVEVVALGGRTVIPGLWDAHVHAVQWAGMRRRLDVGTADSAAEAVAVVAEAAADGPPEGGVLVGVGMRDGQWPDVPDSTMLDEACRSPVVLQSADLHTAWLNAAALERFGLADHPTGILREAACHRVIESLPQVSPERQDRWVADAMTAAASRGVTGIRDFEFGDAIVDWQRRFATMRIDVRVDTTVYATHLQAAIERGWHTGQHVPGTRGRLRAGHLKLFVDGSLNSQTALCHDPYPGDRGDHGSLETRPEELTALVSRAWAHGIEPAIHAIGDRAVTIALDTFEQVGCPGRLEHAQLVASADLPRFACPGLVTGIQPAHAPHDRDVADHHWAGRTSRAYPFADLLSAGATLEIGSDAPVSPLDPWEGIAAAVTRTHDHRDPWHPEQRIDVRTALTAACGGRDTIDRGDPADLVVLDDDPLRGDAHDLRSPSVWGTLLAGRWTHRS